MNRGGVRCIALASVLQILATFCSALLNRFRVDRARLWCLDLQLLILFQLVPHIQHCLSQFLISDSQSFLWPQLVPHRQHCVSVFNFRSSTVSSASASTSQTTQSVSVFNFRSSTVSSASARTSQTTQSVSVFNFRSSTGSVEWSLELSLYYSWCHQYHQNAFLSIFP